MAGEVWLDTARHGLVGFGRERQAWLSCKFFYQNALHCLKVCFTITPCQGNQALALTRRDKMQLQTSDTWQTQARGSNDVEYQIYLTFADDGKGGDITRNGAPLLTYDEWMNK